MAKITFTIEDQPNGSVKTVANPNFETLAMKINSGHEITPAEGYALAAINRIVQVSKDNEEKTNKIFIPKTMKKL